jgi:hypothetical protein
MMRAAWMGLWAAPLVAACGAGDAKPGDDAGADDTGGPGVCAPPADDVQGVTFLMHRVSFARAADGVAWGSDLDGVVSAAGDPRGCNKLDLTDPEGTPGIDNAFAGLLPALEQTEAAAISGLLQDSVEQGELLLTIQVRGLDSMTDDSCVSVAFGNAEGAPLMGTDGVILAGQSFARNPADRVVYVDAAQIEDGRLLFAGDFGIKLQILDANLDLDVTMGQVRMDIAPDGQSARGHFTGGVSIPYMLSEIEKYAIDADLKALLNQVLPVVGDLSSSGGACDMLSIAFEFEAIPAFFYQESLEEVPWGSIPADAN